MKNINVEKQNIVLGSSHLSNKKKLKVFDRIEVMIDNMSKNKAYKLHLEKLNSKDLDGKILEEFKTRYKNYRQDWLKSPEKQYQKNKYHIFHHNLHPSKLLVQHLKKIYMNH